MFVTILYRYWLSAESAKQSVITRVDSHDKVSGTGYGRIKRLTAVYKVSYCKVSYCRGLLCCHGDAVFYSALVGLSGDKKVN